MNETIQSWIERAASSPGMLACGVRLADRSALVRSCRDEFLEPRVTQALKELSEAAYALQQGRIAVEHMRWSFQGAQIRCVTKSGGVVAALFLAPELADSPVVEQLLADFVLMS
jgi:hypothetical protein